MYYECYLTTKKGGKGTMNVIQSFINSFEVPKKMEENENTHLIEVI